MGYEFDWDPMKAQSNIQKHGISFEEASTVFDDPFALYRNDPDHSLLEDRFIILGMSIYQKLLVVSFDERPPSTRLISARRATRNERRKYEEKDHGND